MAPASKPEKNEVTYLKAIAEALWEEMESDSRVFLLGEDIGVYGGAFKVTEGFLDHFGEERVVDTPLEEAGFIGAAIGAALMGMRPVVEVQYADFIACGLDQIVNMAAKMHYRTGDPVPLVIRGPSGGGVSAGPFHSQSPEAWFAHVPGLKVVVPSTPYDAKGLLKSAIRDDNPVIFFEHKKLYRSIKAEIETGGYTIPLGKGDIKRQGKDLSIIAYGAVVHTALEAAAELENKGIDVEIVDLRTLLPLDKEIILESVAKTNRALIVHEDTRTLGTGAEISAILAEEGFGNLDAPVVRLTAPDTPVPFSPPLEKFYIPSAARIVEEAERVVSF
jgi:2-oxoisovalerate dehydrogenase E1 component beta subunit